MLIEALAGARDLGRAQKIARVLVAHGLGDLAHRSGLVRGLRRAARSLQLPLTERLHDAPTAERLRRAFEELGPTFVKLGQLLAGRTDLLPPDWTAELAKLREHAAPVPWPELRAQLAEDLGAEPEAVFAAIEPIPLAAASIAQVHRARLADGTEVVLKIRRPGIVPVVAADLRLLQHVAEVVEREVPELARWRPCALARQLARSIRSELDLTLEARTGARIAAQIAHRPEFVIPRVEERFTTRRLLVLDFLPGQSLDRWIATGRAGEVDGHAIASLGAATVLEMVFVHGLYHADPHGGNVLLLPDGRLGLIDFGMVGRLSKARRRELLELLHAAIERREGDVVRVLLGWVLDGGVDESSVADDVAAFLDRWHGARLKDVDVTALLADVATLLRQNGLALPSDIALLLKLFVTLDDLGTALDPDFALAAEIEPFVERALREERSAVGRVRRGLAEIGRALDELPRSLSALVERVRQGRVAIQVDVRRLDQLGGDLRRSANRLTMGLITSALIVGTSIALTVAGGPELLGLPAFALLGFVSSLVLGVGLIVSIARSTR